MATIKEIAERSGTSLGTVDRVLHNRGRVSPETTARIKAVIEELGFSPNLLARNLSTAREYRFGVLIPELEQDGGYWQLPWLGMQRAVRQYQAFRVELVPRFFDRYDSASFVAAFKSLCDLPVDGMVSAPVVPPDVARGLDRPGLPAQVCIDTEIDLPPPLSAIGQDSYRSGRLAAHLMRMIVPGGGTVGVIQPDSANSHIAGRVRGIVEFLAGGGLVPAVRVRPPATTLQAYRSCLAQLFECGDLAGVVVTDATTHLAAEALESACAPRLPLIGYDLMGPDVPWLDCGRISFLVNQDPIGQGENAVAALFNHIVMGKTPERRVVMPLNIVSSENYRDFLPMSADAGPGAD